MNFIKGLLKIRTIVFILFSQVAVFVSLRYQLSLSVHPVLIGLMLAFPLGFSLQAAFKRRDRALEYMALYKAGSVAVYQSIRLAKDLAEEKRDELRKLLLSMTEVLHLQLLGQEGDWNKFAPYHAEILKFLERNAEDISSRILIRAVRYLKDVTEGSVYLIGLVSHRTMVGIRGVALVFIFLFPAFQAPSLVALFGAVAPPYALYLITFLSTVFLMLLYEFQEQIEYPFSPQGPDRLKLDTFRLHI